MAEFDVMDGVSRAGVSFELDKIKFLARHLAKAINEIQFHKDDLCEEKEQLMGLYWVAETIAEKATHVESGLYPLRHSSPAA